MRAAPELICVRPQGGLYKTRHGLTMGTAKFRTERARQDELENDQHSHRRQALFGDVRV